MKVQPTQLIPRPVHRAPLAAAGPSRPFNSLLAASPDALHGGGNDLKAFSEGGLLGASTHASAAERAEGAELRPIDRDESEPELTCSKLEPEQTVTMPFPSLSACQSQTTLQRERQTSNGARIMADRATVGDPVAPLPALVRSLPTAPPAKASPRAMPPREGPKPTDKAQTSLVLADGDEGLQIIAAAPGMTKDATERLRKRVAELGGEFGLDLTDLQLNGEQIESPPLGLIGVLYGR